MTMRRCLFTPSRYRSEPEESTAKRFIADQTDPPGFTVKFINKTIGKGVFTTEKRRTGKFLFEYQGELVSNEEGCKREKTYPAHFGSFIFFFKVGRKKWCVDATFSKQIGRFANDAVGSDKNAEVKVILVDKIPHLVLFATRNIAADEEIRYDYGVFNLPWRNPKQEATCTEKEPLVSCQPVVVLHDIKHDARYRYNFFESLSIERQHTELEKHRMYGHRLKLDGTEDDTGDDCLPVQDSTSLEETLDDTSNIIISENKPKDSSESQLHDYLLTASLVDDKLSIQGSTMVEETLDIASTHIRISENKHKDSSDSQLHDYLLTASLVDDCLPVQDSTRLEETLDDASNNIIILENLHKDCPDNLYYPLVASLVDDGLSVEDSTLVEETLNKASNNKTISNHEYMERGSLKIQPTEYNSTAPLVDVSGLAKCGTKCVSSGQHEEISNMICLEKSKQASPAGNQETNKEKANECSIHAPGVEAHRPDIFWKKRCLEKSKQASPAENQETNKEKANGKLEENKDKDTEGPYILTKLQFTDECVVLSVKDKRISENKHKDPSESQLHEYLLTASLVDNCLPVHDRSRLEETLDDASNNIIISENKNNDCPDNQLPNYPLTASHVDDRLSEQGSTWIEETVDIASNNIIISNHEYTEKRSLKIQPNEYYSTAPLGGVSGLAKNSTRNVSSGQHEETSDIICLEKSKQASPAENQETNKEKANECSIHAPGVEAHRPDIFWKKRIMRQSVPVLFSARESLTTSIHAQDTTEERSDTGSQSKRKKPKRPCPFCGVFRVKLSDHLQVKHKTEPEVKQALSLPPQERIEAFSRLRKSGILIENVKRMKNNKNKNKGDNSKNLIRERRQGKDTLVNCLSCKAFLSKRQFHKHRRNCCTSSLSKPPPNCVQASVLESSKDKGKYLQYESEILEKFRSDDIGKLCKTDWVIKAYGFQKFLSIGEKNEKKDEKRKTIMTTMRQIARFFLDFKEYLLNVTKSDSISVDGMFMRENWKYVKEVLHSKKTGDSSESLHLLGNNMKRFSKFFYDYLCDDGQDEKAASVYKFRSSLKFNWSQIFGESEYKALVSRSETRKPGNLPDEDELKILTEYTIKSLQELSEDTYNFIAESEFTLLRDLVVCRLTLFNARRGGEPSRLTLAEWKDAENDIWKRNINQKKLNNPEDIELVKKYKVTYQRGKRDSILVPVIFPDDCLGALKILADPEVRKDANVNTFNVYLFPRIRLSDKHVIGSDSIRKIRHKVSVETVTATKVRHRAATVYAGLDVDEEERSAFYKHLGHSDNINKHIYQCPPALSEVTKVGKFLQKLDRDLLSNKSQRKIVNAEASSPLLCADSSMTQNKEPLYEESPSLGFLYAVAEPYAVDRVLKTSESLIEEHEVETIPERIKQTRPGTEVLDAAKPLFTSDAWLAVESLIGCLKPNKYSKNTDLETKQMQGNGERIQVKSKGEEPEKAASSEDDENGPTPKKRKTSGYCRHVTEKKALKQEMTAEMQSVQWSKADTDKVNHFFAKQVFDMTRYDLKGNLPGYAEIRKFLKIYPSVLSDFPMMTRIKKHIQNSSMKGIKQDGLRKK